MMATGLLREYLHLGQGVDSVQNWSRLYSEPQKPHLAFPEDISMLGELKEAVLHDELVN